MSLFKGCLIETAEDFFGDNIVCSSKIYIPEKYALLLHQGRDFILKSTLKTAGGEIMLTGHGNLRLKYLNYLVSRPGLKVTSPSSHVKDYSPSSELIRGFLSFLLQTVEKT